MQVKPPKDFDIYDGDPEGFDIYSWSPTPPSKGGMRTNGGCRCDNCPVCDRAVRPGRLVTHSGWCTQQKWIPDHHRPTPRAAPCAPPTHHAFDIDIYDCPCGHMYGDHEYRWWGGNDHANLMDIVKCCTCEVAAHG